METAAEDSWILSICGSRSRKAPLKVRMLQGTDFDIHANLKYSRKTLLLKITNRVGADFSLLNSDLLPMQFSGKTLSVTLLSCVFVSSFLSTQAFAQQDSVGSANVGASYSDDGQLNRPANWREWIYVGTPVTPNELNDGKAAFPEFHNTYIDPWSYRILKQTGEFPEGTMIAKELVSVGSKAAVSGNGYFQGDFQGLEIAVKDNRRFSTEPGGWAYFSFGHQKKYAHTATKFATAKCNSCHEASADTDFVFTQYYPVLRAALAEAGKPVVAKKPKKMSADESRAAAAAMGGSGDSKYEDALFRFLKAGKYRSFQHDSKVRPSAARTAHGDVAVYVNDKLGQSMAQKSQIHPVGSFAVKELHKDGLLIGWASAYKARKDDGAGSGWYWYENLSTKDGMNPVASGFGHQMCTGCHTQGKDFVATGWPLQ